MDFFYLVGGLMVLMLLSDNVAGLESGNHHIHQLRKGYAGKKNIPPIKELKKGFCFAITIITMVSR